ncbi:MAG: HU family DNA-binding protein [bacterium]|nr:HU family DNA-binding protein [bacterium]
MNKASLIDTLVEKTGLNKKDVEAVLDTTLDTIVATLQNNGDVNLTGFGKFSARTRSARMGVDPQNPSNRIQVPAVVVPKFKAGKALKDALKHTAPKNPTE